MKVESLNWKHVEDYLTRDNRCVIPVGSTEQHAYLSLATDSILAKRIATESAEPLGIPVFPVMPYGHTPLFMDFPGTVSLKLNTLAAVIKDILDSLYHHGFKRFMIVNGHGGNMPLGEVVSNWAKENKGSKVIFHNWWRTPKTWDKVLEIDAKSSHASWMENFPWTRLEGVTLPDERKPLSELELLKDASPEEARRILGDGSFGGLYQRSDSDTESLWKVAVEETSELMMSL